MNKFTVKEKMGIIHARFYGETPLSVFEEYLRYLANNVTTDTIRILQDHGKALPTIKPSEIDKLAHYCTLYLAGFSKVKIAYVSDTPKGIALAMLFKDQIDSTKFSIKIFSERDTALEWLSPHTKPHLIGLI